MRLPFLKTCLIILVALITSILVIGYRTEVQREKYARARIDISDLKTDLEHFQIDYGRYPNTNEGLGTLFNIAETDPGFVRGTAWPHSPLDPWGNHYFYQSDGENYVLGSFGPHKDVEPDPDLFIHSN